MVRINRSLAIVIGINQYSHIPQLKNAVSDAAQLASVLKDIYGYEVLLLLNQRATKAELDKLVTNLENKTIQFDRQPLQVNKSDRLLFYFAGHGFAQEVEDSEDDKPAGYFMPQNAEDSNSNTWLSMQKLYEAFTNLDCHHLLMILDCCFAGRISWVSKGRNAARPRKLYKQSYDRFIKHSTQQIITSAAHDEKAQDSFRFGKRGGDDNHSPFAHLLLKILEANSNGDDDKFIEAIIDDKVITAHELFTYLHNELGKVAEGQTPALSQPRKYDEKIGEYVFLKGEYIFPLANFEREKLEEFKLDENTNPYKGLASFETNDKELFFGRKKLIEEPKEGLLAKVSDQPLTVVLGASGSGKSSLVKAGLIPALNGNWQVLKPMRPGESPLKALNKILTQSESSGSSIISRTPEEQIKMLSGKISHRINRDSESKLLLVIDQTEELLTLCRHEREREEFLNLLAGLLAKYQQQLRIVLTLRSDFEPQLRDAIEERHWQKAWQDGRFIVTPMNREELQQAIEEPAAQRTLFFESPKLVNNLIDEVIQMPGALPLLSFTLSELYLKYLKAEENQERDDRTITEEDYKDTGGVTRSLTQTADKTYIKLVKEEKVDESTIRNVMLRMVAISGGELARRRVPTSELVYPEPKNEQATKVIDRFVEARLLVKGLDTEGHEYVEPVHDALVTGWQKLLAWKQEEEENLLLQRRLTSAAEEWESVKSKEQPSGFQAKAEPVINWLDRGLYTVENLFNKIPAQIARLWRRSQNQQERSREKPVQFLWFANPYLDVLDQQLKSDDNWLNQVEAEFVQQSVLQKRRNTSWGWRIAIAVILGLSGLTLFALNRQREAEIGQIQALIESSQANSNANQGLEAQIASLRASKILKKSLLQAILPHAGLKNQVLGKLSETIYGGQELNRLDNQGLGGITVFSPDGKLLATTDKVGGIVHLWNTSGKHLRELKGHDGWINSVAFSPDSKLLATGGNDGTARLWDISSGKELHPLQRHTQRVKSVAFSPDGKLLATSSDDGTARLWDISSGKWTGLEGHVDRVNSVAFSPDGKLLATGGNDGTARLWDISSGKWTGKWIGLEHTGRVTSVVFSPDGKLLASSGNDGTVSLWDITSNQFVVLNEHKDWVNRVVFSPDGKFFVTSSDDGNIGLWDTSGQKIDFQDSKNGKIYSIAFSPNGKFLASGGQDGTVRLWETSSGQFAVLKGHNGPVYSLAFSPDSKLLATSGDDRTVRLWETSGNRRVVLKEGNGSVHSVAFSPDDKFLATVGIGEDDNIAPRLWDNSRQEQKPQIDFTLNQKSYGIARLWDAASGQPLEVFQKQTNWLHSIAFSPDGKFLASGGDDDTVSFWDIFSGQPLKEREPLKDRERNYGKIYSMTFSPDGKLLATSGDDGTARLWDISGQQLPKKLEELRGNVWEVVFSSDGKQLATTGEDGIVRFWDTDSGQQLPKKLEGHVGPVYSVSFSSNGKLVATSGDDGTARLWDTDSGQQLEVLQGHSGKVRKVVFSPDGKFLATGGWDKTIRLWDTDSGKQLAVLQGHTDTIIGMAFSSDGKQLATGGEDGTARLWQVGGFDELLSKSCDWVRNYLENNPNVEQSDRRLCDSIPSPALAKIEDETGLARQKQPE